MSKRHLHGQAAQISLYDPALDIYEPSPAMQQDTQVVEVEPGLTITPAELDWLVAAVQGDLPIPVRMSTRTADQARIARANDLDAAYVKGWVDCETQAADDHTLDPVEADAIAVAGSHPDFVAAIVTSDGPDPDAALMRLTVRLVVERCFEDAKAAGWHQDVQTGELRTHEQNHTLFPTRLCLIHSEISEAMEGHRKGLMDDKLPTRPMAEVELADALIRICDLAGVMGYDLGGAVADKLDYNRSRADHKPEARRAAGGKAY